VFPSHDQDIEEIVLWPLAGSKWLLKAAYKILFTGWRI